MGPQSVHGRVLRQSVCAQWSPGKDAEVLPWMGQREALSHLTRSMGSPGKQTPKKPSTKKELVILNKLF